MKVLITGASSGIGRDIAKEFAKRKYDLILVSRDIEKLNSIKNELQDVDVKVIQRDLSIEKNCIDLFEEVKNQKIDILINNAGFGAFGDFTKTSLDKEINMINTNITAVHILTKLFLQDFIKKDSGSIFQGNK